MSNQEILNAYNAGFSMFDSDEKGFLKPRMLRKALKHVGFNPDGKQLEQLLIEVDLNSNGKIEFDEFLTLTDRLSTDSKNTEEGKVFITSQKTHHGQTMLKER